MRRSALPDHEVSITVVEKLRHVAGISYADIASTAYKSGRAQLAIDVHKKNKNKTLNNCNTSFIIMKILNNQK